MEWDTEATHVCQKCGTLWRQLDDGHFTLRSPDVYPCCDNAMPDTVPLAQEYMRLALNLAMLSGQKTMLDNRIRTVDGNHTLGAGALAEKIADAINGRGNDR